MTKHKLWFATFILFTLLISAKLVLSVSIAESDSSEKNSASTIYYFCDAAILILFVLNQFLCLRLNKGNVDRKTTGILMILSSMLLLGLASSVVNNTELVAGLTSQLKLILPVAILIATVQYVPITSISRKIWLLPLLVTLLSVFALATFPPSTNRASQFWPVYFSGLHTQAYVILSVFLFVFTWLCIRNSRKQVRLGLSLLVFYALAFGYNVRTAVVCMVFFFLYILFNRLLRDGRIRPVIYYLFVSVTGIALFLLMFMVNVDDFDTYSSGRLSVYFSRFNYIAQRGWLTNLFGLGPGSDLMYSKTWWWEKKGSHNDYITLVVEYGFVYLALFILLISRLFRFFKKHLYIRAALWTYLISSLISNGFMFRPMPAYVFFISVGTLYILSEQQKQKSLETSAYHRSAIQ